jgi:hypothetical protein
MHADKATVGSTGAGANPPSPVDAAEGPSVNAQVALRIEGYRSVLRQIHRLYSNTELRWVCERALAEDWEAAVYAQRAPEKGRT